MEDSSSEYDESGWNKDSLMMVIEYDVQIYDLVFALMEKSDEDKVTILDIKENLKYYSLKELNSLVTILRDFVCRSYKR